MRFIILLVVAMLVGCSAPTDQPQITNHEAAGNLEAKMPLHCTSLSGVSSENTPADIYPGVAACIKAGAFPKAVRLFAVAGAFGRFDQLRVADATARQAVQILRMQAFSSLSQEQRAAFQTKLRAAIEPNSPSFKSICSAVANTGPPTYFPRYMVQHGMTAFTGRSGNGLKSHFDPNQGWRETVTEYLHCP